MSRILIDRCHVAMRTEKLSFCIDAILLIDCVSPSWLFAVANVSVESRSRASLVGVLVDKYSDFKLKFIHFIMLNYWLYNNDSSMSNVCENPRHSVSSRAVESIQTLCTYDSISLIAYKIVCSKNMSNFHNNWRN